jgi:dTMP kinase
MFDVFPMPVSLPNDDIKKATGRRRCKIQVETLKQINLITIKISMLVARTTRLYFLIVFFSSHSLAESFSRIMSKSRGALIVLEGIDRCGKTTQVGLLQETLGNKNARVMRFPDRTTAVGKIIDQYLQSNQVLDDRAVHLLFSANRWECAERIRTLLRAGTTIVCDRYAYSGVAFSAAKVNAREEFILSLEWCQAPDRGLPAPDCVIFLDLAQDEAEKRGG